MLAEIAPAVSPSRPCSRSPPAYRTASIEAHLPDGARVVRAMPNAPALVHEGIAGVCGGDHARDEDLDVATEALGHLGAVVRVAEDDMDAVTALSGSGPAYFALLAEAMIEAGLLLGLSRDVSTRLVVQTMFGSALLLRDEKHASGRAARGGHLARRHDDAGDPELERSRRPRSVPERDHRRDRALARARRSRAAQRREVSDATSSRPTRSPSSTGSTAS